MTGQSDAIGPERVREDDPAAGLDIRPGHLGHPFRMREIPGVRNVPALESARLKFGAPRTVGYDRTIRQQALEG